MRSIRSTLFVFAVVLVIASASFAQNPISDEKQKLVGELVSVFKMDSLMSQIVDGILKEMESTYPIGFAAAVDGNPNLTQAQKEKLKASSSESYIAFSQKFRKRLAERVDFPKYIREVVYPLYDKFYSEQELKELLAFYRTPTGQKVITTLPQLLAESQAASREKLLPQILPIIEEIVREEFKNVGPPPPVKPSSR